MDNQEITYRSLNVTAVLGLVAALFSGLAFFWPMLWPLVLIALVVCWTASRTIAKNSDLYAGAGLARAGLFIALVVGIASFAQTATLQRLHKADVDIVANHFIDLVVAGDLIGAKELMQPYKDRQATAEHAAIYYQNDPEVIQSLLTFEEDEAVVLLQAANGKTPEMVKSRPAHKGRFARYTSTRVYQFTDSQSNSSYGQAIVLLLERSSPQENSPLSWRVKQCRLSTLR